MAGEFRGRALLLVGLCLLGLNLSGPIALAAAPKLDLTYAHLSGTKAKGLLIVTIAAGRDSEGNPQAAYKLSTTIDGAALSPVNKWLQPLWWYSTSDFTYSYVWAYRFDHFTSLKSRIGRAQSRKVTKKVIFSFGWGPASSELGKAPVGQTTTTTRKLTPLPRANTKARSLSVKNIVAAEPTTACSTPDPPGVISDPAVKYTISGNSRPKSEITAYDRGLGVRSDRSNSKGGWRYELSDFPACEARHQSSLLVVSRSTGSTPEALFGKFKVKKTQH